MTVIAERRGDGDVLAGFLVVTFLFVAFMGREGAPIVAGLFALGALGVAAFWIRWRRAPASMLAISPDEVYFGGLEGPGIVLSRADGSRLLFRRGFKNSGLFLVHADSPEQTAISMLGFNVVEVQAACEAHGWTVA